MTNKRLRMFAGPNGSGKSTVLDKIKSRFDLGTYLNADEIEQKLRTESEILIEEYNLKPEIGKKFSDFINGHSLFKKAIKDGFKINLVYNNGALHQQKSTTHSYEASIITDFLRQELIKAGQKISFETVMSHPSKIETLKLSKECHYKNYLYYICTENVEINKSRVIERVLKGGHPVAANKIEERYFRSLALLSDAIENTYRTFIFDNSGNESRFILDIFKGEVVTYNSSSIPKWVDTYCLKIP